LDDAILILAEDPEVYAEPVRDRYPGYRLGSCSCYDSLESTLRELCPTIVLASKLGTPFPRDVLLSSPSVRWIQAVSAGVDHLLPLDPRVQVTSASGIHDEAISDYVVCALLLSNLRFPRFFQKQRERAWAPMELVAAKGQTLVVLGLGSIGRLVAEKARGLGMRVIGVKARPEIRPEGVDEVEGVDRLEAVVSRADFLAVTLPLTPATRGMVGADVFRAMKPGAALINVSRGGIVEEDALVTALKSGRLGGAVSDVFSTEPLPAESELWDLENLVVTPHTGDIQGWQSAVADLFCRNLERWRDGEPLLNRVDPVRGY
jgi:phosphoglycerate dehydrogenase-like enzyme